MFDIEEAFRKAGIENIDRERIMRYCREEFSDDEMMYELHVVRAIYSFNRGYFKKHVGIVKENKGKYSPRSITPERGNEVNK